MEDDIRVMLERAAVAPRRELQMDTLRLRARRSRFIHAGALIVAVGVVFIGSSAVAMRITAGDGKVLHGPTGHTSPIPSGSSQHRQRSDSRPVSPAPNAVLYQCKKVARHLGYAIPCPSLLPKGAIPSASASALATGAKPPASDRWITAPGGPWRGRSVLSVNFPLLHPQPNTVRYRSGNHLVIASAPGVLDPRHLVYLQPAPYDTVHVEGQISIDGVRGVWVRVPGLGDSIFDHHLVLVWSVGENTYGVGEHGWGLRSRRIGRAVARSVHFIGP